MCRKQLIYCSPLRRCFTLKPSVVSAALGRMCGLLAPWFGRHCSPYHSVRCVKRPEESAELEEFGRGHEGLAKAPRGLLAVGWSATTDPVEKTMQGSGISHKALHGERWGRGQRCMYKRDPGSLLPTLQGFHQPVKKRNKTSLLCVTVINLFMDTCTSAHPSVHARYGEQPTIPFHLPDQCPSLLRS